MLTHHKKLIRAGLGVLVISLIFLILVWRSGTQGQMEVIFLNVGQGDSILIRTPDEEHILIDGGPDNTVINRLGQNLPFYDRGIDLVVLTHPDSDHLVGLVEVLKRYPVKRILATGLKYSSAPYQEWQRLIAEKKIPFLTSQAGESFVFDHQIKLEVLYPFDNLAGQVLKETNEGSIVAKLIFGQNSFLFTGDAPIKIERQLLKECETKKDDCQLESDLLKVAHHGSKNSSSKEFLEKVNPEIAVFQVGQNNKFGHPHLVVLKRLEALGAKIYRNDLDGEIKAISDGVKIRVKSED